MVFIHTPFLLSPPDGLDSANICSESWLQFLGLMALPGIEESSYLGTSIDDVQMSTKFPCLSPKRIPRTSLFQSVKFDTIAPLLGPPAFSPTRRRHTRMPPYGDGQSQCGGGGGAIRLRMSSFGILCFTAPARYPSTLLNGASLRHHGLTQQREQ